MRLSCNPNPRRGGLARHVFNFVVQMPPEKSVFPPKQFVRASKATSRFLLPLDGPTLRASKSNFENQFQQSVRDANRELQILHRKNSMDTLINKCLTPVLPRSQATPAATQPRKTLRDVFGDRFLSSQLKIDPKHLPVAVTAGKPVTVRFELESPVAPKYLLGRLKRGWVQPLRFRGQNQTPNSRGRKNPDCFEG